MKELNTTIITLLKVLSGNLAGNSDSLAIKNDGAILFSGGKEILKINGREILLCGNMNLESKDSY
jgi:hypothetical protein